MPEGFSSVASFINQSEHSKKFMERLSSEFFLSDLDPIEDYNVQTIFSRLPESSEIAKNECISMASLQ